MKTMMNKTMTGLTMGTAMALSIGFASIQAFAAEGTMQHLVFICSVSHSFFPI